MGWEEKEVGDQEKRTYLREKKVWNEPLQIKNWEVYVATKKEEKARLRSNLGQK